MLRFLNLFAILIAIILINETLGCEKVPPIRHGRKSRGDNGYRLFLGDEPKGYEPGKIYNLFLLGSRTHSRLQQFSHFLITAEASSDSTGTTISEASPKRVGRFQLFSDSLATFNENCVNTVSESDDFPKSEIQVMWVAPPKGSGCVLLSSMVYENARTWFADNGELKKIICEQKLDLEAIKKECCACDDAKYSFVFEGIWSNTTHPKNYPFAIWLTHFSDIIGASHEPNFSFWGENHIATDGFRSLAEWGSVRSMEIELRAKGSKLRTLIKAGGLWYPNVNANTSSHFKVDRKHNKVSLASMFGPSPDWVVGVSGLNLCNDDCSWTESLDIPLYPWDSGTDNGISYMSPNAETLPRERMTRITAMYPEDPRAPFYDPVTKTMVPLAKLYLRREKLIPRSCDDDFLQAQVLDVAENNDEENNRPECDVTDYSPWNACSVTCGKGLRMRTRQYKSAEKALTFKCNRQLIFKEMCVAAVPECEDQAEDEEDENLALSSANTNDEGEGVGVCKTTKWSEFSECSTTCGVGFSMRVRTFIDHMGRKKCPHVSVVEKEKCMRPECSMEQLELPDPMCPVTTWSDWSPCSVTCGDGIKFRKRLLLVDPVLVDKCSERLNTEEKKVCKGIGSCQVERESATEICSLEIEKGACRGTFSRFAYSEQKSTCIPFVYTGCRGNRNNFETKGECLLNCGHLSSSSLIDGSPRLSSFETNSNEPVDCVMSKWSDWSACSVACGSGIAEKIRTVLVEGKNNGVACPRRVSKQKRCFEPPCA